MFNFDNITDKNHTNWPYRTLVIGPSRSGKTNYLLNLIQKDKNIIDKIYLYAKYLEKPKYQLLIKKGEDAGIKNLNDPTAFIEYSNNMDDVYDDINDYNKKRKRNVLIVFDDMISHVMSNKKAQQVLKELFIRCRKLNILLVFITQSYFSVPKDVRLNCNHYVIFKLKNKRDLQNIAINHSSDTDYKDFIKIYRNCTKEPYNFLAIDITLHIDKRFKNNFSDLPLNINEQVKILDDKIKANKAQYDLDRQSAKIAALSSGELENMNI